MKWKAAPQDMWRSALRLSRCADLKGKHKSNGVVKAGSLALGTEFVGIEAREMEGPHLCQGIAEATNLEWSSR